MKFVFSAFSVGLASSFAATVSITESIQERRDLLFAREKQADREKLEAKIYSYRLKEKIQEVKAGKEAELVTQAKDTINSKVVPPVRGALNTLFSSSPQEIFEMAKKKLEELGK